MLDSHACSKMADSHLSARVVLEDGTIFYGKSFGSKQSKSGEVGRILIFLYLN